jgi:hypothetical protein
MKRNLIIIWAILYIGFLTAQPCFPEGLVFKTQEELNQFPIDNPNCTIIEGDLSIDGYWIDDLSPLSNIMEIQGNFTHYYNAYLYDFTGMDKLTKIGGTFRVANSKIEQFIGLENLDSIGGNFELEFNNAAMTLDGLESLKTIGGSLIIGGQAWSGNPYLGNISGLSNLDHVGGDIQIMGSEWLQDLNGLEKIDSVFGSITIGYDVSGENLALKSMKGLDNLKYVQGDLVVESCPVLNDLSALSSLTSIEGTLRLTELDALEDVSAIYTLQDLGGLVIELLPRLKKLEGPENIDSLPLGLSLFLLDSLNTITGLNGLQFVGDDLELEDLYLLKSLDGLQNLEQVEEDVYIEYNYELESLQGLEKLTKVGGYLSLYRSPFVQDLSPFSALQLIDGGLEIGRMHGLKTLEGMSKLEFIGNLSIDYNDSLISLKGLENAQTENCYMFINNNSLLTDITGIQHLDPEAFSYISIKENPLLSDCAISSICGYFALADANIIIENNMEGCMNNEEVEYACKVLANNSLTSIEINIFPNPGAEYLFLNYELDAICNYIILYDIDGLKKADWPTFECKLYVGDLPSGIYYLQLGLKNGHRVTRKVILSR